MSAPAPSIFDRVLGELFAAGATLEVRRDAVKLKAPVGVLSPALKAAAAELRADIAAHLAAPPCHACNAPVVVHETLRTRRECCERCPGFRLLNKRPGRPMGFFGDSADSARCSSCALVRDTFGGKCWECLERDEERERELEREWEQEREAARQVAPGAEPQPLVNRADPHVSRAITPAPGTAPATAAHVTAAHVTRPRPHCATCGTTRGLLVVAPTFSPTWPGWWCRACAPADMGSRAAARATKTHAGDELVFEATATEQSR